MFEGKDLVQAPALCVCSDLEQGRSLLMSGFAVSPFMVPTMWKPVRTVLQGCAIGRLAVRVRECLPLEFSQGEQGLACFLTHLDVPLAECPVSVHTAASFSELMIKAF